MGWAIALAAVGLTPAAAERPGAQPRRPAPLQLPTTTPADATADAVGAAATPAPAIDYAAPTPGIGVPDGRKGVQDQVTELGQEAAGFHDNWLLLMCAVISLFVLALLVWTIVRYRRGANPTPSRTSHNTADRGRLDAGPGADPGGDRDSLDPADPRPVQPAAGRPHHQGDRQPMVLDLSVSRQWRVRDRLEHAQGAEGREAGRALSHRRRRPAAARGRRADGHPGRQGGEVHRHLQRRHPRLRRPRLLDQDRRQPRPAQRDLGQGRPPRRLFRPVQRAVRRAPRLYADRGRGGARGDLQRLGRVQGRHAQGRRSGDRSRPRPAARPDRAEVAAPAVEQPSTNQAATAQN